MRGWVGLNVKVLLVVILTFRSAAPVGVLRVTGTLPLRRTGSRVITIAIVGIIIIVIATEASLHQKTGLKNTETSIARTKGAEC